MKDELTQHQIDEILKALDNLLEKGPWQESNFLRVIGKNLTEIRENFVAHLSAQQNTLANASRFTKKATLKKNGQREIFISLYSSEGDRLQSWERIIANLPRHMISRPIYSNEEDVKAIIASKENKHNEAYVAVYINETDLLTLSEDKTPKDRLGKKLLTLKDRTLNLDNIAYFIHEVSTYHYVGGRLIRTQP